MNTLMRTFICAVYRSLNYTKCNFKADGLQQQETTLGSTSFSQEQEAETTLGTQTGQML